MAAHWVACPAIDSSVDKLISDNLKYGIVQSGAALRLRRYVDVHLFGPTGKDVNSSKLKLDVLFALLPT